MSSISKQRCLLLPIVALWAALLLGGCVQGPWEYAPEERDAFRGLQLNGYVMAGEPLSHFCVEKTLSLKEYAVPGLGWYRSAVVEVSGDFGAGEESITLTPQPDRPSCFVGPDDRLPKKGENYTLFAEFVWDSSGQKVTSTLEAVAKIPKRFSINDTARIAASALLPPSGSSSLEESLPDDIADTIKADTIGIIIPVDRPIIIPIEKGVYTRGDTVDYLTGQRNMAVYFLKADHSDDLGGVLLTQHLPENAFWPENNFSRMMGLEPQPMMSYTAGVTRRFQLYPATTSSGDVAFSMLDSIAVMNLWFHGGHNRFKLYGMEVAYRDYLNSEMNAMFDGRVPILSNVEGGRGYFVGGVADSFDLVVKLPPKGGFSNFEAHADYCSQRGWRQSKNCRLFEPEYCEKVEWNDSLWILKHPEVMSGDNKSYRSCWEMGFWAGFFDAELKKQLLAELEKSGLNRSAQEKLIAAGEEWGCFQSWMGQNGGEAERCREVQERYFGESSPVERSPYFLWCEDRDWLPDGCMAVAHRYCSSGMVESAPLCGAAQKWCDNEKNRHFCQMERIK